ncbi:choline transport protein [Phlyctema vagabunda]|uniref:Choline transport protein n=1 Tax=Phlyctema vagabunda TaxID=108571 RepID=A0ABR4P827_9HELO
MDIGRAPDLGEPTKKLNTIEQDNQDALALVSMGYEPSLVRRFNIWSMLALAFSVLGTWSTFAQDLSSGLENGGPITILWGLCLVTACNLCIALSLGELLSAMPTALGQAYWIDRLTNTAWGRFTSYMCAWINTFGWWALTASQIAFMTNFLLGIKVMFDNDWEQASSGWVQFLVYIAITSAMTAFNCVICRKDKALPWFNNFIGIQFTTLFVVFSLALVISVAVRDNLHFQSGTFVFGKWINQTSWPDGVVWFTGLIQAAYGLTAFDSVIHMIEEISAPRTNGPKVIWLAVAIGAATGGIFMVFCLFCIQRLDSILDSPIGLPFAQLIIDTVGLQGAGALITLFCFNGLGQGVSIMTTASRLSWGFARDGGFTWSEYFSKVDAVWKVPIRVLLGQGVIIGLIGILYLFSTTVLEAILSVSTIALTISYAMPIITLLVVGRDKLPPGPFVLGRWGPLLNYVSVIYCCITTVFFFFPGSPNPSAADMNYAIVVFGIMLVIAVASWFVKGKKDYLKTDEAVLELFRAMQLENNEPTHIEGIVANRSSKDFAAN